MVEAKGPATTVEMSSTRSPARGPVGASVSGKEVIR